MIYIVHTYYSHEDKGKLHLVRTSHELAELFKSIEGFSPQYDIYEIPESGPMRTIEAPPMEGDQL